MQPVKARSRNQPAGRAQSDRFESFWEAKMELFDYIETIYNLQCLHSTIGQVSPAAFEKAWPPQAA
jgi:transposase InsO family protein